MGGARLCEPQQDVFFQNRGKISIARRIPDAAGHRPALLSDLRIPRDVRKTIVPCERRENANEN